MPAPGPLTSPTQNTGAQAQGSLYASQALEGLKKAISMLDPTSPLGQAVLDALKKIGKHVGAAPAETQQSSLQNQLIEAKRTAMQRLALQQMQQQGGGASPSAAPGAAAPSPSGAAAPPSQPMPMAA